MNLFIHQSRPLALKPYAIDAYGLEFDVYWLVRCMSTRTVDAGARWSRTGIKRRIGVRMWWATVTPPDDWRTIGVLGRPSRIRPPMAWMLGPTFETMALKPGDNGSYARITSQNSSAKKWITNHWYHQQHNRQCVLSHQAQLRSTVLWRRPHRESHVATSHRQWSRRQHRNCSCTADRPATEQEMFTIVHGKR